MRPALLDNRHFSSSQRSLLERAFAFAQHAHKNQKRFSGEAYIAHPVRIAEYLARIDMDAPTIAAALLHDVLEDTRVPRTKLAEEFGDEIVFLVEGVTKLKALPYKSSGHVRAGTDPYVASLKKLFLAMAQDIRVIIIKLADRLHNIETLKYLEPEDQRRIALETLEIYAPIADRLGMGNLKGQLEDLSFPYVYPQEHRALMASTKARYEDRLKYLEHIKPIIAKYLTDADIVTTNIHSRAKRSYSLFQKLQKYDMGMDAEHVFDLVALRIIVPDVKMCYEALGVIHAHYKPLPGRIKDYIAMPKPNGYQSLHTTVFCERGKVVEIQIRTPEMHLHAEQGIAAHWAYSETGKPKAALAHAHEVAWVNELKETLKTIRTREGLHNITVDFFKNHIFVFTPKGDIKDLPDGATPIDLAYAVHTGLGHATVGAKVNGAIVPLAHELCNGDVIEIMKSKSAHPSRDWLSTVKTAEARKKIRAWLMHHDQITGVTQPSRREAVTHRRPTRTVVATKAAIPMANNIIVNGQHGLMHKLGKCCRPTHGQDIRGYITVSHGVTIHLASCPNLKKTATDRILDADWE